MAVIWQISVFQPIPSVLLLLAACAWSFTVCCCPVDWKMFLICRLPWTKGEMIREEEIGGLKLSAWTSWAPLAPSWCLCWGTYSLRRCRQNSISSSRSHTCAHTHTPPHQGLYTVWERWTHTELTVRLNLLKCAALPALGDSSFAWWSQN